MNITDLLDQATREMKVENLGSEARNHAATIIATAANGFICFSKGLDIFKTSMAKGIDLAKVEGMSADDIRNMLRSTLELESLPNNLEKIVSNAFEVVVSDDSQTIAQNIKQTLETRPANSRPATVPTNDVVELAELCAKLAGGDLAKMLTLARSLTRNLEKQKNAAK